jgi:hypothetical protein
MADFLSSLATSNVALCGIGLLLLVSKSGSTEARAAGAPIDDVKKRMGYTAEIHVTEKVYDLPKVEAHHRIAQVRKAHRERKDRRCQTSNFRTILMP